MNVLPTSTVDGKNDEIRRLLASRKRKLRALYAVANDSWDRPDNDITSEGERHFLDACDILKNRFFDERLLPQRRRIWPESTPAEVARSDGVRKKSAEEGPVRPKPAPRIGQEDTPTIGTLPAAGRPIVARGPSLRQEPDLKHHDGHREAKDQTQDRRPTSGDTELVRAAPPPPSLSATRLVPEEPLPPGVSEEHRIRTELESRPGSPGVDPRKAVPISPEDAARLPGPLLAGFGDPKHKAVTAHLPPLDVPQEAPRISAKPALEKQGSATGAADVPVAGDLAGSAVVAPAAAARTTTPSPLQDATAIGQEKNVPVRGQSTDHEQPSEETAMTARGLAQATGARKDSESIRYGREGDHAHAQNGVDRGSGLVSAMDIDGMVSSQIMETMAAQASQKAKEDAAAKAPTPPTIPDSEDVSMVDVPSVAKTIPDLQSESQTPVEDILMGEAPPSDFSTTKTSVSMLDGSGSASATRPDAIIEQRASKPIDNSPLQKAPLNSATRPSSERMTTRVSSGAIERRSVSDILGEAMPPKSATSDKGSVSRADFDSPIATPPVLTPRSANPQHLSLSARDKDRSQLATVVFAKPSKPSIDSKAVITSRANLSKQTAEDYFMPLFLATATNDKRVGLPPIENLLMNAHKTITTTNAYVAINEQQITKILKRIYTLQNTSKWSLRQPKRSIEPARPTTHWDVLLQEVKWMRTDFREERKWKMAVAKNLASACAEWHAAGPEERQEMQVAAKPPRHTTATMHEQIPEAMPELVASTDLDSPMDDFDDEEHSSFTGLAPTAIFALQDDDVVFNLRSSPTADKLLKELPLYGQPLIVPATTLATSDIDPDRFWKRPAVPLSRFVEGRMEIMEVAPPRKRSRYDYEEEDEDEDEDDLIGGRSKRNCLSPEQTNVALFNPENKHLRERIHSAHHFRPPSEFPMPMQSFFECRMSSQWTWAEDDELKSLVREYTYNWSLISSMLSTNSLFQSGAERRTPWECFERWIHLEGLPADMQKTHYFRHYNSRIDAAQRNLLAAAAQVPTSTGAATQPPRRKSTASIRVERRRNQKHLSMVEAMRKAAKKRENALQKQQHAATLAQNRRAQEVPTPRNAVHTPQDFSRLKYEREEQAKERMQQQAQRQEAFRRASLAQQAQVNQQRAMSQQGMPVGGQIRPGPGSNNPLVGQAANAHAQNLAMAAQHRARGSISSSTNPLNGLPNPMGVPQAQMLNRTGAAQIAMPGNPAVDLQLLQQAHQIQQIQQRQIQRQGQNAQMYGSPPRSNGMPRSSFPDGMMPAPPALSQAQSQGSPKAVATPPTSYANPMQRSPSHGDQASPNRGVSQAMPTMTPAIEAQIRQKRPELSDAEVVQYFHAAVKNRSYVQSALGAVVGNGTPRMGSISGLSANGDTPAMSPHQAYAQMLIAQQRQQRESVSSVGSLGAESAGHGNLTGTANSNGTVTSAANANLGQKHANERTMPQGNNATSVSL